MELAENAADFLPLKMMPNSGSPRRLEAAFNKPPSDHEANGESTDGDRAA